MGLLSVGVAPLFGPTRVNVDLDVCTQAAARPGCDYGVRAGPAICVSGLLAQPLSDRQSIYTEMLSEVDFRHSLGMGSDGDHGGEVHRFGQSGASFGQVAGRLFKIIHV